LPGLTVEQMEFALEQKKKPNWLFRILIAVSVGIHLVIFMHIAGVYQCSALSYIELTLKEISKHSSRSIPRPRHVHVDASKPEHLQRIRIQKITIPPLRPIKPADVKSVTDYLPPERAIIPALNAVDAPKVQKWTPGVRVDREPKIANGDTGSRESTSSTYKDCDTPRSYLGLVRFRIESHKKYPDSARKRQIEGRVTVGFVIGQDGRLIAIRVVKSAGKRILDEAALNAVRESSPFPRPPANLFKAPLPLQITIVFELT